MVSVLVVGAGQIGVAVARELPREFRVSVHCRRRGSVLAAAREAGVPRSRSWYGDLLSASQPFRSLSQPDDRADDAPDGSDGSDTTWRAAERRLSEIVALAEADVVVDTTNLATSIGDRWQAGRDSVGPALPEDVALSRAAATARGRAVAVHRMLRRGVVHDYVRVSTTGLGGRGLELPFTHGDAAQGDLMSPALWLKLMFAGMEHQALWALARSFPGQVHLLVPRAFVGFEAGSGSRGLAAAGEDRSYTAEELAVLSSPLQMGAVTREEVAQRVVEVLRGRARSSDLLAALQSAAVGPSLDGFLARQHAIDAMRDHGGPALVRGALGRRVSVGLVALRTLREQWPVSLQDLLVAHPGSDDVERSVSAATLAEAREHGIRVGNHTAAAGGALDLCVCDACSRSRLRAVRGAVSRWRARAGAATRCAFDAMAARPTWFEGDLLAVLWEGVGAEEELFNPRV